MTSKNFKGSVREKFFCDELVKISNLILIDFILLILLYLNYYFFFIIVIIYFNCIIDLK